MENEIAIAVREKGLLLDRSVLELLNSFGNSRHAVGFLESLEKVSGHRMITKNLLINNVEFVKSIVGKLPGEEKEGIEKTFVKLGISLEIRKEREVLSKEPVQMDYQIFYSNTSPDKKIEVRDFVGHFRARYETLRGILLQRTELQSNLVGINKISNERQSLSIIGIVTEKRVTKNKNLMVKFEDLTGEIVGVVRQDSEAFSLAEELQLDDVVGVKASGNSEMLFIHDILYPDSFKQEKVKFDEDCWAVFLSDLHCGSRKHLGKEFEKFLKWLNEKGEIQNKIRYMFFIGDNVDGVGIFPGREGEVALKSMEEQYSLVAKYLRQIPKHVVMFMCPGQHDAVRVAEPQPLISRRYAESLYGIENLNLVTNPCMVKLIERNKEFKVLMNIATALRLLKNNTEADEYLKMAEANIVPGQEEAARRFIEDHRKGKLPILL